MADIFLPIDIDAPAGELATILQNDLQAIVKWMGEQTIENVSDWDQFKNTAQDILNKIIAAKVSVQADNSGFKEAMAYKQLKTKNKHLQEVHHIHTLQIWLTRGYMFIQSFREWLIKEKIDYLLLFDDGYNDQVIKKISLAQLLPTLVLQVNSKGNFVLQIKNTESLKQIKEEEGNLEGKAQEYANKIINVYNQLLQHRQRIVKNMRYEQVDEQGNKKYKNKKSVSGYEFGQAGTVFEIAARKIAEGINMRKKEIIEAAKNEFKKDTHVFYKAGDMPAELVEKIFQDAANTALELKRVSTRKNTVGAQLAADTTIEIGLQNIINAISNKGPKTSQKIQNELEKLFKIDKSTLEKVSKKILQDGTKLSV